jgi:hypothetical protein
MKLFHGSNNGRRTYRPYSMPRYHDPQPSKSFLVKVGMVAGGIYIAVPLVTGLIHGYSQQQIVDLLVPETFLSQEYRDATQYNTWLDTVKHAWDDGTGCPKLATGLRATNILSAIYDPANYVSHDPCGLWEKVEDLGRDVVQSLQALNPFMIFTPNARFEQVQNATTMQFSQTEIVSRGLMGVYIPPATDNIISDIAGFLGLDDADRWARDLFQRAYTAPFTNTTSQNLLVYMLNADATGFSDTQVGPGGQIMVNGVPVYMINSFSFKELNVSVSEGINLVGADQHQISGAVPEGASILPWENFLQQNGITDGGSPNAVSDYIRLLNSTISGADLRVTTTPYGILQVNVDRTVNLAIGNPTIIVYPTNANGDVIYQSQGFQNLQDAQIAGVGWGQVFMESLTGAQAEQAKVFSSIAQSIVQDWAPNVKGTACGARLPELAYLPGTIVKVMPETFPAQYSVFCDRTGAQITGDLLRFVVSATRPQMTCNNYASAVAASGCTVSSATAINADIPDQFIPGTRAYLLGSIPGSYQTEQGAIVDGNTTINLK